MDNTLDGLLQEALREGLYKTNKAPAKTKRVRAKYSDPENWTLIKAIALVHKETNTLLGNFNEYIHNSMSARKLVRVKEAVETSGVEYVSGDFYLTRERQAARTRDADKVVEKTIGITLTEMGVHAPDAKVRIHLLFHDDVFYGISKIELVGDTRFNSIHRDTFLYLDAGLDIIEAMDRDSKIALKAEMGL